MLYLSGFVGFLLLLTAEAGVGDSSKLKFCTETDQCLLFDLICKTDQYEARFYNSVKWVTTEERGYIMEIAFYRAFKRLYEYINANNIDMTSPVLVKKEHVRFFEMGVYTMGFLLPSEHQMNPPEPTDDRVRIFEMPPLTVYVKSYGGWMTSYSDRQAMNSLSSALDSGDVEYIKDFHFAAGYNSPMTLFNRHNEVWFVAADEPDCSSSSEEDD